MWLIVRIEEWQDHSNARGPIKRFIVLYDESSYKCFFFRFTIGLPDAAWASTFVDDEMNKALSLMKEAKYDEAITYLDKVLATKPNSTDALYNKGAALGYLGKNEEAITYYDKALAIEPNHTNALNNKGVALSELGKSEEAITYYDKALAIDPNATDALNNKAKALDMLGK